MKVPEVILRAVAKKIAYWRAGEIIRVSDRSTRRRWKQRYTREATTGCSIDGVGS
jgi:hypothetical protein